MLLHMYAGESLMGRVKTLCNQNIDTKRMINFTPSIRTISKEQFWSMQANGANLSLLCPECLRLFREEQVVKGFGPPNY